MKSLLTLTLLALAASPLSAAGGSWNATAGGSTSWATPANWTPAAVPGTTAGDVVNFTNDIVAGYSVRLDGIRTVGDLNIGDSAASLFYFTLAAGTGGILRLDNFGAGDATVDFTNTANDIPAPITLVDNAVFRSNVVTGQTIQGIISGAGKSVTFNNDTNGTANAAGGGRGSFIVNGVNTYSGGTTISDVVVQVRNSASALGTGNITIAPGGEFNSSGNLTFANSFTIAGNGFVNSSPLSPYGAIHLGGDSTVSGNVVLSAAAAVGSNNAISGGTISGIISGNHALSKRGGGTIILSGANTFSGGLTVASGTLILGNSRALGSGAASVSSGATLNLGGQTVTNAVTMAAGSSLMGIGGLSAATNTVAGNISPGDAGLLNGLGTVNLSNANVTLSGTCAMELIAPQIGGNPSSDEIIAAGSLNLAGTVAVTFGGGYVPVAGHTWDLFYSFGSMSSTAGLNLPSLPAPLGWNSSTFATTGRLSIVDTSVNMAPTAITLNRTRFAENRGPGEVAATLAATDGNLDQSHTFTLVSGIGSADNSAFTIQGANLVAVDNADFEAKSSYSFRVRATDSGSPAQSFEQALVLQVVNFNDSPSNIVLSRTSFPEDYRVIGANSLNKLGLLSATDPDSGTTATDFDYFVAAFDGLDDNHLISIVGNTLFMKPVFNYEGRTSYKFRVKVVDNGLPGFPRSPLMSLIKEITINVTDVNEPTSVANVTAGQRPASDLVDISYNLSDSDANTTVAVSMVVSADNGVTWNIPVSSATGDIGPSVKAFQDNGELSAESSLGKSYRSITWDAGVNWNEQKSYGMKVRLTVGSTTITSNVFPLNTIGTGRFTVVGVLMDDLYFPRKRVVGATISMGGSTATSDSTGLFKLENVVAGPMTFSKNGYRTLRQPNPDPNFGGLQSTYLGPVRMSPIQPGDPGFTDPLIESPNVDIDIDGRILSGFGVVINYDVNVVWGTYAADRIVVSAEKTPGKKQVITTLGGPGPYKIAVDVDRYFDGSFDPQNNQIIFEAVPKFPGRTTQIKRPILVIPLPQQIARFKPSRIAEMQFPPRPTLASIFFPRPLNHLGFDYTFVDLSPKVQIPALGDFGFAFKAQMHFDYTINDAAWETAVIVGDLDLFSGQYRGVKRFSRPGMPFEIDGDRPKLELYLGPRIYAGAIAGFGRGNAKVSGINPDEFEVSLAMKREEIQSISLGEAFPPLKPVAWLLGSVSLTNSVGLNGSAKIAVNPFAFKEGTLGGTIGRKFEYEIGDWWASASCGIGGVANATFRLPPPILKDAGMRFYATWKYGVWAYKTEGTFTIGEFRYTGPRQFQPSDATEWKPMEREWREGGVEAFLQTPRSGGMAIMSAGNSTSRISPELALFNQLGPAASVNVIPSDPGLPAQAVLPLLANVMPLATPSLAQRDGKLMLAYVRDTGAANPVQFSEVAFTYYDGTSWTTPGPVAADARGQIDAHVAFAGNGDAIAVWNRIKDAAFADTTGPEQMAPQLEIVSSRWSSATRAWGPVVALTNNSILDSRPILSGPLTDGDLMLSWVSNPSNELKGSGAPGAATNDQFLVARWDTATSTWSAPTVVNPSVTNNRSVAFAARGNKAAFVWIQDPDGDPDTSNDTELYSQVWNGTSWGSATRVTNDLLGDRPPQVAISPSGDIYTLWVSGTDLVMQTNFTGPRSVVRADSGDAGFSGCTLTVADNGRVLALWQAMSLAGPDAFYRVFDPASNTWGLDDQLSRDSSMEKSFSAVWDSDSNLVIAYNNVEMVPTTQTVTNGDGTTNVFEGVLTPGTNDLLLARRRIVTDLALVADSFVTKADSFLPGSVMALKATLRNTGNLAVQNATVTFYLGDPAAGGTVIGSTTVNGWLRASEERVISQNWTIPGGLTRLVQIYAVADPASAVTEFDETNNQLVYETSGKDLELIYLGGMVMRDGSFMVSARVLNTGVTDSAVTDLRLWTGLTQTAAPISTEPVGRIAPDTSVDVTFNLPAGSFAGGDQRYNMVLNSSARDAEIKPSDNQSSFTLSLFIDDDDDGIPLQWEQQYGMSDSNAADAALDADGDGFSNRDEYLCGTNPNDRSSLLKVGEFNVQTVPGSLDRVFTISWASVAEKFYVVERSEDFVTWTAIASGVTATAPVNTWRDEPLAAARAFYRVRPQ